MNLEITIRVVGNVTIVDTTGRLTLGETSSSFRAALKELLESGRTNILLNLRGLTYIDSSGLGELTSCYITGKRLGAQVRILGAQGKVREMIDMTRLFTLFPSFSDEAEAVRSFNPENS